MANSHTDRLQRWVELDSSVTGRFGLERADQALESDLDPNSLESVVYPMEKK
jgi:hypothetical protein